MLNFVKILLSTHINYIHQPQQCKIENNITIVNTLSSPNSWRHCSSTTQFLIHFSLPSRSMQLFSLSILPHSLPSQTAPSPTPKRRQPLLPQVALIWWLCKWVWWGFFVGLVEIFYGFDGEIVVDLQMFCGFDVEIMGDLQMRGRSNGFDGFANGWMALQMVLWVLQMGFDGFAKVKLWCCNWL